MRNRQGGFIVFAFVGWNRSGSADGSPDLPVDRVRFLCFLRSELRWPGSGCPAEPLGRVVSEERRWRDRYPFSSAGGTAALPFGRGVFVVSAGYETIAQALCFPFPVSRFFGSCGIRPSNADVRLSRWAGSSPKKDAGGTATPFRVLVGPPPPFGRGVLAVFSGRKAICKDSYDFPPRFLDVRHPILFTVRVSRVAGGKAESSPGKFSLRFCTERGEV